MPHRSAPGRRERAGLSLLEAVVAIAIVGATSLAAFAAAGAGVRATSQATRAHEAAALLEERRAVVTLLTERELQRLPDSVLAGRFAPPFDEYTYATAVRADDHRPRVYRYAITVAWPDGALSASSVTYRAPGTAGWPAATPGTGIRSSADAGGVLRERPPGRRGWRVERRQSR